MANRFASHFAIAASIAGLGVVGSLMPQRAAADKPSTDVSIVSPLPLPVSAAQSGTWNVNVLGTPTFNLATPGAALAVRNIDEPGRTPYQSHIRNTNPAGLITFSFGAVPAGKRLVIEQLSYFATSAGCLRISFDPQGFIGEATTSAWLLPTAIGGSGGSTECSVSVPMRAYADPGQAPGIVVPGNLLLFDATLSGYLVDCAGTNPCAAITH
jgi:hypothetical protein